MDNLIFAGYEFLAAFVPFLLVFLAVSAFKKKQQNSSLKRPYLGILIFAVYLIGVYHFTGAGTWYDLKNYQWNIRQEQLNIIPFSNDIDMIGYVLNVCLFVPLGFLFPFLCKKMDNLWCIFSVGFCFSLFIEFSQLYNNRCTDIDDLILNSIGAFIGLLLFRIWKKLTKSKYCFPSISWEELLLYMFVLFLGRALLFNEMGFAGLLYKF